MRVFTRIIICIHTQTHTRARSVCRSEKEQADQHTRAQLLEKKRLYQKTRELNDNLRGLQQASQELEEARQANRRLEREAEDRTEQHSEELAARAGELKELALQKTQTEEELQKVRGRLESARAKHAMTVGGLKDDISRLSKEAAAASELHEQELERKAQQWAQLELQFRELETRLRREQNDWERERLEQRGQQQRALAAMHDTHRQAEKELRRGHLSVLEEERKKHDARVLEAAKEQERERRHGLEDREALQQQLARVADRKAEAEAELGETKEVQ